DESLRPASIYLSAYIIDVNIDHVGQCIRRKLPDMMDDRGARHILAGVEHKVFEQGKFLGRQFDASAAPMYGSAHAIQLQIQTAQDRLERQAASAQQSPHASRELGKS